MRQECPDRINRHDRGRSWVLVTLNEPHARHVETVGWRGHGTHDHRALGAACWPGRSAKDAAWLSGLRGRAVVDPLLDRLLHRLDASREPSLPAMDPDFSYSMSDLDRIHDRDEWTRIHRS